MSAIVLNKMYAGDYLKFGKNIGHEIINLYKSDNGCNYIYINPYGWIAEKWDKKISEILLVQMINNSILEILGVASDLQQILCKYDYKKEDAFFEEQKKYVRENGVKYGSVYLDEVMKGNKDDTRYKPQLVTFKAGCVKRPNKTIYLTTDKSLKVCAESQYYFCRNIIFLARVQEFTVTNMNSLKHIWF